jgi:CubicO group peptidase (beta-lactamase class C family)
MHTITALDDVLRAATTSGAVPGLVAMATSSREAIYQSSLGVRDLSKAKPMTQDSVFWIASMTKAITTAAAMQLVEQGKLQLDDPIGGIVPEFASPQVMDGLDDKGAPKLRPAKSPITLRHLMTHTAGFCYDMWNADMLRYMTATGLPRMSSCKRVALTAPLAFDPGTRWEYGINVDVIGRMIEEVSGQRLDQYIRDHIFAPLGMASSGFRLSSDMRSRLVRVHARGGNGSLTPIEFECEQEPEQHMGGGGLYSTAPDYIRFVRMILNKGRAGGGHQVLKPETVATMAQNHIGDLEMTALPTSLANLSNPIDFYPGIVKKWGLGFMINTEPTPEGRSAGSLAWAGLSNCYYWIDPSRDVAGVILMQVLPFADETCLKTFADFERGIYAALGAKQGG